MRLINIHTLELHEFLGDIPPYAILSHRWSDDEISYKYHRKGRRQDSLGYLKVLSFCRWLQEGAITKRKVNKNRPVRSSKQTLKGEDGSYTLNWAWIDTCCIDKRRSAELSEAINPMFAWYVNAAFCIAWLHDVGDSQGRPIADSEWWTKGWTLQELLAPKVVVFCDVDWRIVGHECHVDFTDFTTRKKRRRVIRSVIRRCLCEDEDIGVNIMPAINDTIATITGIDGFSLRGGSETVCDVRLSAALKMSWAAKRTTTRPEDLAYCLMGFFRVKMPLLYGEGTVAFRRLQMQILDQRLDQSLFAFEPRLGVPQYPLFADDPRSFGGARHTQDAEAVTAPFQIKQSMLCIDTDVSRSSHLKLADGREILIIKLNCTAEPADGVKWSETYLEGYELALAIHSQNQLRREQEAREIEAPRDTCMSLLYKINVQEMLGDERPLHHIIPFSEREALGRQMLYIHAFDV